MNTLQTWPDCFDNRASYEEWLRFAHESHSGKINVCRDCTPEHLASMVEAGRCDYPGVTFRWARNGKGEVEYIGVRPR